MGVFSEGARRPGTFYHVMRAAIYVELRLPLEAAILSSRCGYGLSLVPRPHPQEEERVWSELLVVLSQHAYGNFVMQSDSHVTTVAPFEPLCIRLQRRSCFLFIARSRRSAWKDAYQQLTGRVVAGMASEL